MEYFPYGDLSKYLSYSKSRLPVEEARELTRQILEALFDMHRNGFAHRDLKPSVNNPSSREFRVAVVADPWLHIRIS